jgi:hypothetical protein
LEEHNQIQRLYNIHPFPGFNSKLMYEETGNGDSFSKENRNCL